MDSSPLKDKGKLVEIEIEIEILGLKILLKINAWRYLTLYEGQSEKEFNLVLLLFYLL